MKRGRHLIGGLYGLAAATGMAGAAPAVHAQQDAPTPVPLPSQARPSTTLPNVTPERFTLAPPAATPTPTPAPVVAPPPVIATPSATATPRANAPARTTPTPAATPAQTRQSAPAPAATPTPLAAPSPAVTASAPVPIATPSSQPLPQASAPPSGMPGWLWALIGGGATALAIGGLWALQRRRKSADDVFEEAPVAAPPPPRPVVPPPGIAPAASAPRAAPAAPSGEPFELILRPGGIEVTERDVLLDFELLIGNLQPSAAENIRVAMAMMSANPDQDRNIAGYHANPMVDPAAQAFDLAAGAGGRMPVRLALPRELVHVVQVHARPMFVPMVMIEVKWRAGISIRRFGADFMVGVAGQGAKLGPIWLDRNQQARLLAATRYLPREAAAA
ncbi:hypothetical protein RZN05_01990 [Sphingomonas sp. HF-S4]|uniref:LPXTG cell wall anchor domain-containing protein n=1 Tax=Sphingomonas agrestis TaxID=3080540 RepID=A0ABU3Y2Z8_9SPHN|nr:hypothetical protein [Sphingomonas sp. HF-S4]MDV3455739.1 hypothetical protein [Sphingomonas sp. HF-S4]